MTLRERSLTGRFLLGAFLIAVLSYGLFEARRYLAGPELVIETPAQGALLHGGAVEVRGIARNISFISLNDRQIYVDETGAFSETITPPPGYTVVTVAVRDRFNRERTEMRSLIVE